MNKKAIAILLAIAMICTVLTSCSSAQNEPEQTVVTETTTQVSTDENSFKLSYSQSDSLNPYKAKTLNNQIVDNLVYESLFVLDEGYKAQPAIAAEYNYTDAKTLIVTIANGIKFSNGADLTTNDIVRSFNRAKESARWKNALKPIASASAIGGNSIQFNLNHADPYAHNLLTFAITNEDEDENGYLLGTGRYMLNKGDGRIFLSVNKSKEDFTPHFTRITLTNITTASSIDNAVNIGNISYAFRDLSEGDNTRISCNKKIVSINNLVYIGVNGYTGVTSNPIIRKAISLAIDREILVKSAYQGYAKPATSVFNPYSEQGKASSIFTPEADTNAARQAVAQSGYAAKDLKLDILVNENPNRVAMATLVKQQLESVGFTITISSVSDKSYKSAVKHRSFNIYIGETKVPADMNMNSFFSSKGATRYGIDLKNINADNAYDSYLEGESDIGAFLLSFNEDMPFIPVLYRKGMICYSKSLRGDMQGYDGNYFSNIQDWYYG